MATGILQAGGDTYYFNFLSHKGVYYCNFSSSIMSLLTYMDTEAGSFSIAFAGAGGILKRD